MAISKRLRYEILRRDDHACRYCGGIAPDAVLTVDHVVPTALGGSDDPSNLVAACKDCNAGKSASPVDGPLVAGVAEDAIRWAAAMQTATEVRLDNLAAQQEYVDAFLDKWNGWHRMPADVPIDLPNDWKRTIVRWYGLQVPSAILLDAVDRAMTKRGLKGYDPEFRYMAGVVWSTLTEIQNEARAMLDDEDDYGDNIPRCDHPLLTPEVWGAAETYLSLAAVCDVHRRWDVA